MNPDSENFDQLRKLLALKRHEVPPPGYFNSFSSKVVTRIEAGETTDKTGWAQRFWSFIEANPMLTGAFGAAVCAVAISGFVFSDEGQAPTTNVATRLNTPFGGSAQPVAMNVGGGMLLASTNQVSPDLQQMLNQPGMSLPSISAPVTFGVPAGQ
jgi:hypothetical protein